METMDFESWEFDDDYPGEFAGEGVGDLARFVPGLSPSLSAARRLLGARGRTTGYRPRPGGAMTAPAGALTVQGKVRQLEQQQRSTATQLAVLQQRNAARQASDTFGPAATAAVAAFALAAKQGRQEVFSTTLTHGLPMVQLLAASRGRAISSGFRANPVATLAFPAGALLLALLKDKLPWFAPVTVDPPDFTMIPDPANATGFIVNISRRQPGSTVRQSTTALPNATPTDPTLPYTGTIRLAAGESVKLVAVLGSASSEVVTVRA